MRLSEIHIKGKPPNRSKNYSRMGGNKQQYKWVIALNNGKTRTVWADSRYNAVMRLSTNELIIGVRTAKKVKREVAE